MKETIINELKRLKFEELLWIIFIIICILNIYGDKLEEKYIITKQQKYTNKSNKIFKITLIAVLLIYTYFFIRNYNAYKNSSLHEKKLYKKKLLGSSFLIVGILLLIYFQFKQKSFIGSPAL